MPNNSSSSVNRPEHDMERIAAETALFPTENPDPVLRIAHDGRLLYANEASAPILAAWSFTVGQPVPGAWRALIAETLESGLVQTTELMAGERTFSVRVVPIAGAGYANLYGQEITERLRSEQALRESEERFRALVMASSEALYRMSPDWAEMRQLYSREFLASSEQPNPTWLQQYVPPAEQPRLMSAVREAIRTKSVFQLEHQVWQADGGVGWMFSRAVPLIGADGEIVEWFGAANDITARRRAEIEVRQQAAIHQAINRILEQALGSETEEQLGRTCLAVAEELTQSKFAFLGEIGPHGRLDDIAISDPGWELCQMDPGSGHRLAPTGFAIHGLYGRVLQDGTSVLTNDPASHPDSIGTPPGHPKVTAFLGVPLRERDKVIGLLALGNREGGYTEDQQRAAEALAPAIVQALLRKRVEEAARRLNETLEERVVERTAQLRALGAKLVHAEEQERNRLARLLHDELQQMLAAAMIQLNLAQRHLAGQDRPWIGEALGLLEEAVESSRSLTTELSPAILHDEGLIPALFWLGQRMMDHYGLLVAVDVAEDSILRRIPEETAIVLFQSARELLFNVHKHAGVRGARMELAYAAPDHVRLVVVDEGRGFDVAQAASGRMLGAGFGLPSVQERILSADGQCLIESGPGAGTRITLTLPLVVEQPAMPAQEGAAVTPVGMGQAPTPGKLRLVVADDHALVRRGLIQVLNDESDLEVVGEAEDGLEAIARVRQAQPDVVLVDVRMPRMDGVEATRHLVAEFPGICVVGLSMFRSAEQARQFREAGAAAYVAKDGPPDALLAAIRACPRRG